MRKCAVIRGLSLIFLQQGYRDDNYSADQRKPRNFESTKEVSEMPHDRTHRRLHKVHQQIILAITLSIAPFIMHPSAIADDVERASNEDSSNVKRALFGSA